MKLFIDVLLSNWICSIIFPSVPQVSLHNHIMENISSIKYMPKRLVLTIYGCCLTFFFFCAFYTYSITRIRSNRPISDVSTNENFDNNNANQEILRHINLHEEHDQSAEKRKILRTSLKYSSDSNHSADMQTTKLFQYSSSSSQHVENRNQRQFLISGDNHLQNQTSVFRNSSDMHVQSSSSSSTEYSSQNKIDSINSKNNKVMEMDTCVVVKSKLILLWTPFFQIWEYLTSSSFSQCSKCNKCLVTTNRSMLLQSDAVIFHARDMSVADLPTRRLPHQIWVFYCLESPPYSDFPGLQFMHKMFNWTMTYRLDSDIISDYGSFTRVQNKEPINKEVWQEKWRRKTKSIVWMSSHCPTRGGRDNYVKQLKKYIDVDEFGSCGNLICPKDSTKQCLERFATTHKFFLAFENSICKDYVTEKFFRTLSYDIIPVVFGGASYDKVAPPRSYVDALSFKSPKHLAYFLSNVGNDFDLYFSYFEWQNNYTVRLDSDRNCIFCSMLHEENIKPKTYLDLRKWWTYDGQCKVWKST